ncbi:MAG TPA: double-cubane-cluster-containing anaerobic reductase [Thermoanaerobaculaceae bacterium]|nr:double-cubane-cluster-containing anaerobic reductase [Thermoanaerobaculaceae bacterium]HRS16908.1 double-cubane-cluster-containing anaerobic reductase [Thermoanaerobaculaceae bacterium]
MSTNSDYHSMWANLGLDLAKHDALLGALGQLYQQTFLAQRDRPAGMAYFDFVMSEVHGLRIKELVDARAAGRKVVGSFCVYVPEELILALDGVSVGLCAGAEFGFDAAEQYLPRTTCALIKSFFGFALEKVCPYLAACDLVVGEATCDGKKKAYETFAGLVGRFHAMDMPQHHSPEGRALLKAEFLKLAGELEEVTGRRLEPARLRAAIATVNARRAALARLARLRAADPAPISGLDALLVNQVAFYDDPVRFTKAVTDMCDELERRVASGEGVAPKGAPRILLSGCPMAVPNWKVPALVEQAGAVIVGEESCVGERGARNLVDATGETVEELIDRLVDRYFQIDCAIYTPNPERLDHVRVMRHDLRADGIIHYALQFCTPYQMEAIGVERQLEAEAVPVLRIETDYGAEDAGQLRTRIEAFIERLRG